MNIIINKNLKLEISGPENNCLHLDLNQELDTIDLEYLTNQLKYQMLQFSFDSFLINAKGLKQDIVPLIELIMTEGNKSASKIGFVLKTVEDIEDLYILRDLLKEYSLCNTRIFIDMAPAQDWIYTASSLGYAHNKETI